ncbi:MAG: phosphoribosylglycinamide formyltransferase [Gemmatimonadota bacterium]
MSQRLAVFVSGRGSNLESLLKGLAGHSTGTVVLVVSDRVGAPALDHARSAHIPTATVEADDGTGQLEILAAHAVDWIVLAGYLKRVPKAVVAHYRNRILNIHPALLPRHGGPGMYGLRVHEAVLTAGDTESGASVHLVDEEYDHGPVVAQRRVRVEPEDTPASLARRVLAAEHALLSEVVIAAVEGRLRTEDDRAWIEGANCLSAE